MPVKTEESQAILVPGNLSSGTLATFYVELDNRLKKSPIEIVIDCSRLDHATSNHISLLWETLQRSKQAGIPIRLLSVRYGLKRVLEILDLYDLFDISTECSTALQLKIRPTSGDIDKALNQFRDFLKRLDLDEICAFDLETVFYEVITNIRLYGRLNQDDLIEFTATPNHERIAMQFVDLGPLFDLASRGASFDPQQAIKSKQKRGFGLIMIKRLVDTLSYERLEDRLNVVTLEKRLYKKGR
jgi:anti-anti-sigma factor